MLYTRDDCSDGIHNGNCELRHQNASTEELIGGVDEGLLTGANTPFCTPPHTLNCTPAQPISSQT